ncbi:MAG TPA: LysM peptidoglycan-binding domain-containing protein [Nocardioidaceae bacterium]|nr:LysM peptidoglycan-binding domain-containing protein [Nocardioidaceae bacterium]
MLPLPNPPRIRRLPRRSPSRFTGRPLGAPTATFAALLLALPALDYTVQPGDTVWSIATEHDSTVGAIVDANDLGHGGSLIYPGDVLTIPSAHRRGGHTGQRPAAAEPAPPHRSASHALAHPDKRRIVVHTVQPGDTVSAIARRYHAWTAEVIESNGGSPLLHVGDRLRVPVVVRAQQQASRGTGRTAVQGALSDADRRAAVRRLITRTAQRHGVDPALALAVSWQEAGWQQDVVSSADAIGAMQVIPSTGRWLGEVTGRDLDLHKVEDNVYAGVVLLKFLTDRTGARRALAGYYQGLGSVEEHGLYDDTRRYIANVLALRASFRTGDYPY